MSRDILVVHRNKLFSKIKQFQGFLKFDENANFKDEIMKYFEYLERNDLLEKNSDYKQIIPYVWLINMREKKVFLYKRSSAGNESRLYDRYSGGVGGHIDRDTEEKSGDPVNAAMIRELKEEVSMAIYPSPNIIGYINDETGDVERVHFGVVAVGETDENVTPAEDMDSGKFFSIKETDALFSDSKVNFENWTIISWPFIKEYIQNLK